MIRQFNQEVQQKLPGRNIAEGLNRKQKWLKDRQGRTLTFDDIVHYQKIIIALTLTEDLMKKVYEVGVF